MDLYLKNATNSNGIIMSSGYNDGLSNVTPSTYPFIGVESELDNTVSSYI